MASNHWDWIQWLAVFGYSISMGPREVKRWTFTLYHADKTGLLVSTERCTAKPMTLKDFKRVLDKRISECKPRPACWAIETKGYKP